MKCFILTQDMHEAHDAYVCVGQKTYVNDPKRLKYSDQHYLKSHEEMAVSYLLIYQKPWKIIIILN